MKPETVAFNNWNPIRHSGYYYDRETGLYYLKARYYNPEWRRFISPDSTAYLDPESANGLNLYAYCGSIGGMYVSTAVASSIMGALAASSLSIPGAVIVVGGAVIAVGVGIAINHLATKLTIDGNTIEGHLNNFADWLIFWD